jgi:hypothetical protein
MAKCLLFIRFLALTKRVEMIYKSDDIQYLASKTRHTPVQGVNPGQSMANNGNRLMV